MTQTKKLHISVHSDGFSDAFYLSHLVESFRKSLEELAGLEMSVTNSLPTSKNSGDIFWEIHGVEPEEFRPDSDFFSCGVVPSSQFVLGPRSLTFSPRQTELAFMAYRSSKLAIELGVTPQIPVAFSPEALYPELADRVLILVPRAKTQSLETLVRELDVPVTLYFPQGNPDSQTLQEYRKWIPANFQLVEFQAALELPTLIASSKAYLSLSTSLYPDVYALTAAALGKNTACHEESGTRSLLGPAGFSFNWERPDSVQNAARAALHTQSHPKRRATVLSRTHASLKQHVSSLFGLDAINQRPIALSSTMIIESDTPTTLSAQQLFEEARKASYTEAGFFYIQEGRTTEATLVLKEALNRNEIPSISSRLLAVAYFRAGETEKATQAIEQAISFDPNDAENYRIQGEIFEVAGKLSESKACFRRVLDSNPAQRDALVRFINCSGALGDWSDARPLLEAYLQGQPSDEEIKAVYQSVFP